MGEGLTLFFTDTGLGRNERMGTIKSQDDTDGDMSTGNVGRQSEMGRGKKKLGKEHPQA